MKESWCSCSPWGGLRGGVVAAAFVSLLAACGRPGNNEPSSTPEPVAGPAANTTPTPNAQPAGGQSYPNLGTVPQQPPATTSTAARQQTTAGLIADNQNAAYSDQPVTAVQQTGTPAPAPLPVPVPVPAPPAPSTAATTTTGSDAGTVATTPLPPPPAPAASVTVGQTVTNRTASAATPPAPAATAVPEPATTPPSTMSSATPMAPPPNPVPPAPAMTSTSGVSVDTSQLGGSPLPGYQPVPTYSSGPIATMAGPTGAGIAPAYSLPAGAAPVAGQPVAVIFFTDASSAISDRAQWVLRNVVLLQQQVGGRLRIVGNASLHTVTMDPQRHDQVNYRISQARANAVARALIGMGIPQGSIGVSAQGSQAPVFYEFMPTGEAANRRVEIYLDR